MSRSGFIFDQAKCTGCKACVLACTIENGLDPERSWRSVHTFNERYVPGLPTHHLSLACNHCESPACMSACPAKAYDRDPVTGAVLIDGEKCIGCGYCSWACPYGAPRIDETIGVMTKCTFCNERQKEGHAPACVAQCPTGALQIGDVNGAGSLTGIPGLPETSLGPALLVVPAEAGRPPREREADAGVPFLPARSTVPRRVSVKKEWPLVVFTFIMPLLAAAVGATTMTGGAPINPFVFLAVAAGAMALSSAHLGKKLRAWRAILNVRESWLSREIFFTNVFVAAGFAYLLWAPDNMIAGTVASVAGLTALFSIDMVYASLPRLGPIGSHSAGGLLSGAFWTGVLAHNPLVAGIAGMGKLYLYLGRKSQLNRYYSEPHLLLSALRILLGFAVPVAAWVTSPDQLFGYVVAGAIVGELIDRVEFYMELDIVTPERQMAADLASRIHQGEG